MKARAIRFSQDSSKVGGQPYSNLVSSAEIVPPDCKSKISLCVLKHDSDGTSRCLLIALREWDRTWGVNIFSKSRYQYCCIGIAICLLIGLEYHRRCGQQ